MAYLPAIFLILVVLILGMATGLSFYFTRRQVRSAFHSPGEYGLEYEEIKFPAKDGLILQGCWIPCANSKKVIVILHGHGGSLDWDVHRAPFLHAAGYNVFLFDFRAHGRSQGNLATFGYLERNDVWGAVDYLQSRGMKRVGLLGLSYGGIVAMTATPECKSVNAVITDGGPARMRVAITARGVEMGIPKFLAVPLAWLMIALTSLRLHVNLFNYEAVRWVGKISPAPVLFIHAEKDKYCQDFQDLYSAAKEPKEVWFVPGVDHTKASEIFPDEFQRRVLEFFNKYL